MVVEKAFALHILRGLITDCKFGIVNPVLTIFMKRYGFTDSRVGNILVHYLCMKNKVSGAISIYQKLKENNLFVKFPVDILMILVKQGRALHAYELILAARENLPILDVIDYSVVINGLCKKRYIHRALVVSELAKKEGVELNVVIYNAVLHGLCRQSCFIQAFRLFDSMERNKIFPSDFTYGTLIDGLVREGYLLDARKLFDRMIVKGLEPNIHIYNSLIFGYCQFNNLEQALKLLDDLGIRSLEPDDFTFSTLLDGFSRDGDLEGALQLFVNFRRKGIFPGFLGFLYLLRGLFAKGRMEEARNVLREMIKTKISVELLNMVEVETESGSVESFLVYLCDQGSIQDAVAILNEIASMFFPYKRKCFLRVPGQTTSEEIEMSSDSYKPVSFLHQNLLGSESQDSEKVEDKDYCQLHNFHALYSRVASLCATGDVQGASKLTREMFSRVAEK